MKIFDYKSCMTDAKKYKRIEDWKEKSYLAYKTAKGKKWLSNCTNHMEAPSFKKWSLNKCKKIAKTYKTMRDWREGSIISYNSAYKYGWLDECSSHFVPSLPRLTPIKWTIDACIREGQKHDSITAWREECSGSYKKAKENGWLSMCGHTIYEKVYTLTEAKASASKFVSENSWANNNKRIYAFAQDNGWLSECLKSLKPSAIKVPVWSKAKCIVEAKNYETTKCWRVNSAGSYNSASGSGWLSECIKHMKDTSKWNLQACIGLSQKFKHLKEFRRQHVYIFNKIKAKKWGEFCYTHMVEESKSKPITEWSLYKCAIDAMNYNSKEHWLSERREVCIIAYNHCWLESMNFTMLDDMKSPVIQMNKYVCSDLGKTPNKKVVREYFI